MKAYLSLLQEIMDTGVDREGRNGSTRALFAKQLRFKMSEGFPAVTTKKLAFKMMTGELLWFIEGSGDENRLREIMGKDWTIWTDNAYSDYWKPHALFDGDCGRIYGVQWRNWRSPAYPDRGRNEVKEIDQLAEVIDKIKNKPGDRRLIVSAWNPGELDLMALPPCHMMFQFFVANGKISLHMTQRSCDMFLGVPFNIASYALLLSMVAQVTDLEPDECILTLNDAHVYHDHFDAVKEQLSRKPLPLPTLWLNPEVKDIDSFTMNDIKLENYEHHDQIKAKMAV
ncbi:MAG: thymidylate synthase [Candidatus Paceibacterota bacterium]